MQNFKHTDIGLIPNDWEVKTLGEICDSLSSGKSNTQSQEGTFPIFGSTGIIGKSNIFDYYGNKILVARVGANAGTVNIVNGKYCVSDNTLIISLKSIADINFIYNLLTYFQLNKLVFGSGQPLITGGQLNKLEIPLPPLPEQTRIAAILSDADTLIANLQALLAKQRSIKQALMQDLLKPKEGWEVRTLEEVAEIVRGQIITMTTVTNGNVPVIAGGMKPAYYHNKANRFGKTITISGSGASAGYISFHQNPIFASDCSTISEDKKYSIEYIYYFLQLQQDKIYKMQTGGAQPHISPKDLNPLQIPFPPLSEQTRITAILSDADEAIGALAAKIEKYKQIKQGMMQGLLTGRVRVTE